MNCKDSWWGSRQQSILRACAYNVHGLITRGEGQQAAISTILWQTVEILACLRDETRTYRTLCALARNAVRDSAIRSSTLTAAAHCGNWVTKNRASLSRPRNDSWI